MRSSRPWAIVWIFVGLIGIVAGGAMGRMFQFLLEHGHFSLFGWLLFILSGSLFVGIWIVGARSIDPETRPYLELIKDYEWLRSPVEIPSRASRMAGEFVELLAKRGIEIDISNRYLPDIDRFLKSINANKEMEISEVILMAGAFYGEVLRRDFGGEWRMRKTAGYYDAIVRIGSGRNRWDETPGLRVFFVIATDDALSLEELYENYVRETSR